jgi:sucrose phosphorylase
MLSLAGVPGIYIHSLFGSRNCYSCFEHTGRARSLNREKFQLATLEARLSDPESLTSQVFSGYKQMLRARQEHPAFHPHGPQQVFSIGDRAFAVLRSSLNGDRIVLCLVNVTPENISADLTSITSVLGHHQKWTDIITQTSFETPGDQPKFSMEGYQILWLTPNDM